MSVLDDVRAHVARKYEKVSCVPSSSSEGAVDLFGEDDGAPDIDAVAQIVDEEVRRYLSTQAALSRPTDAERLAIAFARLERRGIVARHYCGASRSDGAGIVLEARDAAASAGRRVRGYVYYTMEDVDSVTDGQLDLAWGAFSPSSGSFGEVEAHRIAGEILCALDREGLRANWDGRPNRTLRLVDLDWFAPRDPDTGRPLLTTETPALPTEKRYEVSATGEWLLRITYLAPEGLAAHALVGRLSEHIEEKEYADGPFLENDRSPMIYDFVPLALAPLEGRQVRVATTAVVMSAVDDATWRELALRAVRTDAVVTGESTFEPLKAIANLTLADLKSYIALRTAI